MNGFNPYLTFEGTCEEALHFYKSCFNGKIVFIQFYSESGISDPAFESKVMHSEFEAGYIKFMACDNTPKQKVHTGTNISLYISFRSTEEQETVFTKLSQGGTVHLPIEKTIWESSVGILTDKFGIHWMLVYTD